jgi:hypothetical protein
VPLLFKTADDDPNRVDIVGAGVLFPFGKGGVVVSNASDVLPELQEKADDGSLKLDDNGEPIPLTGAALTKAAKEFAEQRGFTTVNVPEDKIAGLPQDAGMPPDRPPMAECGHEDYVRMFGSDGLVPVNTDPEELVNPTSASAGVPVIPSNTDTTRKEG